MTQLGTKMSKQTSLWITNETETQNMSRGEGVDLTDSSSGSRQWQLGEAALSATGQMTDLATLTA